VSVAGLALGALTVTVTVHDVLGNTGNATGTFDHGRLPTLTVSNLRTVARPELAIDASCTSAEGPCTLSASVDFSQSMLNPNPQPMDVNSCVSLEAFEGRSGWLTITATHASLRTSVRYLIAVESSTALRLEQSHPGKLADVDAMRTLYLRPGPSGEQVVVRDRATGVESIAVDIPLARATFCEYGTCIGDNLPQGLYPGGVFAELSLPGLDHPQLEQFDGSTVTDVAGGDLLFTAGRFALYSDASLPGKAVLRDLVDKANAAIDWYAPANSPSGAPLAANGSMVFVDAAGHVKLYRDGVLSDLGSGSHPTTDGVNVAFQLDASTLAFIDGSGNQVRVQNVTFPDPPAKAFRLTGGTLAFYRGSEIWLRTPAALETSISPYASATLETLNELGEAVVCYTDGIHRRRALLVPGRQPRVISSCNGEPRWVGADWFVLLAGELLRVDPGREPVACAVAADRAADGGNGSGAAPPSGRPRGCSSTDTAAFALVPLLLWLGLRRHTGAAAKGRAPRA
jgi:hypothetical protein